MKKIILPMLSLIALLSAVSPAHAEPLSCTLTYDVKGGGLQIGLGYFKLKGKGELNCQGLHGEAQTRTVKVTIGGHPVAARVGAGYLHLFGASGTVGFNGDISDLFGHYLVADAQAAVGLGGGAEISVQNPKNGLRMTLGINGSYGLGAEAGLSVLTIEPTE